MLVCLLFWFSWLSRGFVWLGKCEIYRVFLTKATEKRTLRVACSFLFPSNSYEIIQPSADPSAALPRVAGVPSAKRFVRKVASADISLQHYKRHFASASFGIVLEPAARAFACLLACSLAVESGTSGHLVELATYERAAGGKGGAPLLRAFRVASAALPRTSAFGTLLFGFVTTARTRTHRLNSKLGVRRTLPRTPWEASPCITLLSRP